MARGGRGRRLHPQRAASQQHVVLQLRARVAAGGYGPALRPCIRRLHTAHLQLTTARALQRAALRALALPTRLAAGSSSGGGQSTLSGGPLLPEPRVLHSDEEERAECSWRLVKGLLSGVCGAYRNLICANAKVVLRTLTLLARKGDAYEDNSYLGGASMWPALDKWMDPFVLAWMLEPDSSEEDLMLHSLLVKSLPGYTPKSIPDASTDKKAAAAAAAAAPPEDVAAELKNIFDLAVILHKDLRYKLHQPQAIIPLMRREMRVSELLATMELAGLPIDPSKLTMHTEAINKRCKALTVKAEQILRTDINLASAQQVSEALHCILGLPKPKGDDANKSGHGSTNDDHLKDLVSRFPSCPLPPIVLEHRELSKLTSTFLEPLATKAVPDRSLSATTAIVDPSEPRRVYTTWYCLATGTGRLSSRHPNVQQVPKGATKLTNAHDGGEESGASICVREAFRAPTGFVLLSADYSQLELRLLAVMSNDPKLISFLVEGGDLFKRLTATWHNKPLDAVTPTERQHTKGITYGLMYGLGVEKLVDNLNLPIPNAKTLKTQFLNSFKTLGNFLEHLKNHAKKQGSVTTMGGRSRPLPSIRSSNATERNRAERQAVNSVIQGSAADLMKEAMLQCVAELARHRLRARLIAQLHDEVLFEVHEDDADRCAEVVRECMETIGSFFEANGAKLPKMPVAVAMGETWGTMVEVL